MSWVQMILNASALFTGQLGGGLAFLAIVAAGIYSALHHHWSPFYSALGGSAVIIGAAWLVQTIFGVAG